MRPDHYKLMYEFVMWAGGQSHIAGIALVGPCADDENEEETDLSLLLISDKKAKTVEAILHQFQFEAIDELTKEERGPLTSLRISYASGIDMELGVAEEAWLHAPLEQAAEFAFIQGFKVLLEQEALFEPITSYIETHSFG
ncbi:hypothetical protein BK133_28260 [Paenibacillus sp. FSL H8-0548]|uniref:hypothetical protein n=1 Tax=Paenibacillus sp. FSL H8-0548 TaxID=1920422 RepID=UPI00096FEEE1|nr:hypothetical protein [Paenibacillus sp. FSL H8-0548]OMF21463.1 hypothetical protein BK133_28260 [Paenibacillus sp. FSL H8-0548]